jgi:hypothetical protein
MLRFGQMQSPHLDRERLLALVVGNAQAVPLHLVDMRGPHVDKRHVLPGARHMRSGVAAHGIRADDRNPFGHQQHPDA